MKKLFYVLAFILIALSAFWNISAFAGGAGGSWDCPDGFQPAEGGGCKGAGGSTGGSGGGGSWGNDGGFGGNGGSTGGGGIGDGVDSGSTMCTYGSGLPDTFSNLCNAHLRNLKSSYPIAYMGNSSPPKCVVFTKPYESSSATPHTQGYSCGKPPVLPDCPSGMHYEGTICVKDLQCPAGYKKEGSNCVWQCPAGYKDMGGSCVKEDTPEDCDPAIQECNSDGTPKCDPCSKLQQLINNNLTMINNDNRVISLTETLVSNQNTTNNNINNVNNTLSVINNNMNTVNNNISNVNNNLTTINESIQNVITSIENNKPDFDTSSIVSKLDEVITAIQNNNGVGDDGQPIDLTEIIRLLNEIDTGVKDGKFDDTQLNAYFDEILEKGIPVGVNFKPVLDKQDEQTSLLEDIKKLLMPTNEAGDPSLDLPEVEENSFDAWGAIRGFNINQNIINASSQCPADKSFTINLLVKSVTFSIPMTPMCSFLGYLAPVFLALAYFQGAMIILKAGD